MEMNVLKEWKPKIKKLLGLYVDFCMVQMNSNSERDEKTNES